MASSVVYRDKDVGLTVRQHELVCSECPIRGNCDENSLWCVLSWARGGNEAQKQLAAITPKLEAEKPLTKAEHNSIYWRVNKERLSEYHADWYEKNREKKLAQMKARYQKKKEEKCHTTK
jgi:hypothetical protein